MSIELDTCVELILAKRKSDAEKHIILLMMMSHYSSFARKVGSYIKMEKKNYKIPKDIDAEGLDREKCLYIIENQPKKKKAKAKVKTKAKKK